jgi:hypothetical protein
VSSSSSSDVHHPSEDYSIAPPHMQNFIKMTSNNVVVKSRAFGASCRALCISTANLSSRDVGIQLSNFIGRSHQVFYPARLYSGKHNRFLVKDCETVDEVFMLADDQSHDLHPHKLAAAWHRLSQILSGSQMYQKNSNKPEGVKQEVAKRELEIFDILLEPTMNLLDRTRPSELTTISLAMAKIIKSLLAKPNKQWSIDQRAFGSILLDENLKPQECIFQPLAEAAKNKLLDCEPRYLSNLAYAYALLGNDPELDDSTTMLANIADASLDSIGQFIAQDISNMVWAFATLKISNPSLFRSVGDAVVRMNDLNEFKPQGLAITVWAYATMDLQNTGLFEKIADHIVELRDMKSFQPQNFSNIVWAFATANTKHPGLFEKVGNAIVGLDDLKSFNPQNLANIVWAYATANIQHPDLFKKVGNAIVGLDDLKSFNPQNLANIVWAYATANIQHPGLFKKVGNAIVGLDDLKSFNPQNLANIVWAYATANIQHPDLFKKVGNAIVELKDLKSFNPQNLANTVWAYAAANVQHPGLFKKVGSAIVELKDLQSFNSQDFSNTVWAYATADIQHPDLFTKIADTVELRDLKSFKPQAVSNIVWAFATANIQHPGLFKKVGNAIVELKDLKSFQPQDLSNVVWAYATANKKHPPGLFEKIGDAIVDLKDLKSFKPQALSNIVWAYSTANIQHPGLFKKVGDAIVEMKDLKSFDPQNLSNTVWAYASMNMQHPGLFKTVGNAINQIADAVVYSDNLRSFNAQGLANTAWAFTVSNIDAPLLFNEAFTKALLGRQSNFIDENLRQLYQWHLWQTGEKSNSGLPESFLNKCHQAFIAAETTSSSLQKDVVLELAALGMNPVEEYETPSGYKLDALIEINGKKVGVEVDGRFHFIGRQPNGSTLLKRRQVSNIDKIPLVSVLYWEWNELGKDRDKRRKYLKALFESL